MPDMNTNVILQELVRRSNEDARRLRALEQRFDAIETRINSVESAGIERSKKMNSKFTEIDMTLRSLGDEMIKVASSMDKVTRQLSKLARKQDLREIERMLDLISPLRQEFVTKQDLKEEVEEELKEKAEMSYLKK